MIKFDKTATEVLDELEKSKKPISLTKETSDERKKTCFCHTCMKTFHTLGIARHRAMHRDNEENCKISYKSFDDTRHYNFKTEQENLR